MKSLTNKVVAITGASSGIGRELAIQLANQGCHLALSDINQEGLEETVKKISEDVNITTDIVNVADQAQVHDWADRVVLEHGGVDVIINNAGLTAQASIEDFSYEDFDAVFNVVFYGVLYGTKAFLPHLRLRPEGHVVNISSVNGFFPFPAGAPYNCAKHAVKALNQTLMQELAFTDQNIHVTSVHPGGIKTNIARSAKVVKPFHEGMDLSPEEAATQFDKMATTTAEKAAAIIIRGILKDKKRLLVGIDAYIIDILTRLFPQGFSTFVGKLYLAGAKPRNSKYKEQTINR